MSIVKKIVITALYFCLISTATAASYEITFNGSITSSSTSGGLPQYGLGVGDSVNFRIVVDYSAQGYQDNNGSIAYMSDIYQDCTNPGDPQCYKNWNYYYASYIDGSFLTDPSSISMPSNTAYYAVNYVESDRYDTYYQTTAKLLTDTNRLTLSNFEYSEYICFSCMGEWANFSQVISGQGTVYGSAQITNIVDLGSSNPPPTSGVPILPAQWLLLTGIMALGGFVKKTRQ